MISCIWLRCWLMSCTYPSSIFFKFSSSTYRLTASYSSVCFLLSRWNDRLMGNQLSLPLFCWSYTKRSIPVRLPSLDSLMCIRNSMQFHITWYSALCFSKPSSYLSRVLRYSPQMKQNLFSSSSRLSFSSLIWANLSTMMAPMTWSMMTLMMKRQLKLMSTSEKVTVSQLTARWSSSYMPTKPASALKPMLREKMKQQQRVAQLAEYWVLPQQKQRIEVRMQVRMRLISSTTHNWSIVSLIAFRMMKKVSLRRNSSSTNTSESNNGLNIPNIASNIVKKQCRQSRFDRNRLPSRFIFTNRLSSESYISQQVYCMYTAPRIYRQRNTPLRMTMRKRVAALSGSNTEKQPQERKMLQKRRFWTKGRVSGTQMIRSNSTSSSVKKNRMQPQGQSDCLFWISAFCRSRSLLLIEVRSADSRNSALKAYDISVSILGKTTMVRFWCMTSTMRLFSLKKSRPGEFQGSWWRGQYCSTQYILKPSGSTTSSFSVNQRCSFLYSSLVAWQRWCTKSSSLTSSYAGMVCSSLMDLSLEFSDMREEMRLMHLYLTWEGIQSSVSLSWLRYTRSFWATCADTCDICDSYCSSGASSSRLRLLDSYCRQLRTVRKKSRLRNLFWFSRQGPSTSYLMVERHWVMRQQFYTLTRWSVYFWLWYLRISQMARVMLKLLVLARLPRKSWLALKLPLQRLMKNVSRMNYVSFWLRVLLQQDSIPSQRRRHLQRAVCWKLISSRICLIFMKKSIESDLFVKQLLNIVWIIRFPSSPNSSFTYQSEVRNSLRLATFITAVSKQLRMGNTSSLFPIKCRTSLAFSPASLRMNSRRMLISRLRVRFTSPQLSYGNFQKASSRNSDILRKKRNCLRLIYYSSFLSSFTAVIWLCSTTSQMAGVQVVYRMMLMKYFLRWNSTVFLGSTSLKLSWLGMGQTTACLASRADECNTSFSSCTCSQTDSATPWQARQFSDRITASAMSSTVCMWYYRRNLSPKVMVKSQVSRKSTRVCSYCLTSLRMIILRQSSVSSRAAASPRNALNSSCCLFRYFSRAGLAQCRQMRVMSLAMRCLNMICTLRRGFSEFSRVKQSSAPSKLNRYSWERDLRTWFLMVLVDYARWSSRQSRASMALMWQKQGYRSGCSNCWRSRLNSRPSRSHRNSLKLLKSKMLMKNFLRLAWMGSPQQLSRVSNSREQVSVYLLNLPRVWLYRPQKSRHSSQLSLSHSTRNRDCPSQIGHSLRKYSLTGMSCTWSSNFFLFSGQLQMNTYRHTRQYWNIRTNSWLVRVRAVSFTRQCRYDLSMLITSASKSMLLRMVCRSRLTLPSSPARQSKGVHRSSLKGGTTSLNVTLSLSMKQRMTELYWQLMDSQLLLSHISLVSVIRRTSQQTRMSLSSLACSSGSVMKMIFWRDSMNSFQAKSQLERSYIEAQLMLKVLLLQKSSKSKRSMSYLPFIGQDNTLYVMIWVTLCLRMPSCLNKASSPTTQPKNCSIFCSMERRLKREIRRRTEAMTRTDYLRWALPPFSRRRMFWQKAQLTYWLQMFWGVTSSSSPSNFAEQLNRFITFFSTISNSNCLKLVSLNQIFTSFCSCSDSLMRLTMLVISSTIPESAPTPTTPSSIMTWVQVSAASMSSRQKSSLLWPMRSLMQPSSHPDIPLSSCSEMWLWWLTHDRIYWMPAALSPDDCISRISYSKPPLRCRSGWAEARLRLKDSRSWTPQRGKTFWLRRGKRGRSLRQAWVKTLMREALKLAQMSLWMQRSSRGSGNSSLMVLEQTQLRPKVRQAKKFICAAITSRSRGKRSPNSVNSQRRPSKVTRKSSWASRGSRRGLRCSMARRQASSWFLPMGSPSYSKKRTSRLKKW